MNKYERIKSLYKSCRHIINIIESGDIHDERYKILIQTMTVEQLEHMRDLVKECENLGLQYVVKEKTIN